MGRHIITPERAKLYADARQLKESGLSFAEVGRRLNLPTTTIQRACKEYQVKRQPYTDEPVEFVDPGDLLPEIELMEKLVRKMIDADAPPPIIAQVVATLGKLRRDWSNAEVRAGRTLHIDKAKEFINQIGAELVKAFIDVCPDAHDRIDRVIAAMLLPNNDRQQVKNLVG